MSLFAQFKSDPKKELEGVKITFAPNADGSVPTFIIARMNRSNVRYTKALERVTRPYRRQIELGTLDNMVAEELNLRVFVETVLLNWEGVQDADGKTLAYTQENANALLKQLPDLFDELQLAARNASLYRDESLEGETKN